jgi:hypothetical protein
MQLTITLPDAVHALLDAHPKGAETAVLLAVRRYLKASASEERDQAIADDAVRGVTHAELANKYSLSIPRIQQLVALGREAALLRNPKPKHAPTTTSAQTAKLLKDWSYTPEPARTTTTQSTPRAPIPNPAHDFDIDVDF